MSGKWRIAVLAGACVACGAVAAWAANWADNSDPSTSAATFQQSKDTCRKLKSVPLPAADAPDAKTRASLEGCDSEALYYGIGMPSNPAKARQCAYLEMETRAQGDGHANPGFSGASLLATIYANGRGAARDYDVAMNFACRIDGAPVEMVYRIMHLQQLKHDQPEAPNFSWCDDITSGAADGACSQHDLRMQSALRDAMLARLAGRWKGPAGEAFQALRRASKAFIDARTMNEVDQSGTSRGAFRAQEEDSLAQEFADRLATNAAGHPPMYSRAESRDAQARLDEVYEDIMGNKDFDFGTVAQAGIRDTQAAWLAYRDAWTEFMRRAYPRVPADAMKTWLTLKRISELEAFRL